MNQIFIRLCGTVLAIWNFLIPSAHGIEIYPNMSYQTFCKNEDDILVFLEYEDLPENKDYFIDPDCSGPSSGTGVDTGCIISGANCSRMWCTTGCVYDDYHILNATDPIKYTYIGYGRRGWCTDFGIWMPYRYVKEFKPDVSQYITGQNGGYNNHQQQWPLYNQHEEIGAHPCITDSFMPGEEINKWYGCKNDSYSNTTNIANGNYTCTKCPKTTSYNSAQYTAKSAKTCTGPACCSLSITSSDKTGTFTITNCPYEE